MGKVFWYIYVQPLHRIIIGMLLFVLIWAVIGSISKKQVWWKMLNMAVFLGIIAGILYATVYSRAEQPHTHVLIPFHSFAEAKKQPELYRSMLMNIILFQPMGMSLPNLLPHKIHPAAVAILFALVFSAGIEAVQYFFSLGRCEFDDVIMNTLGAALGITSHIVASKMLFHRD